jgi:hypothetical protein
MTPENQLATASNSGNSKNSQSLRDPSPKRSPSQQRSQSARLSRSLRSKPSPRISPSPTRTLLRRLKKPLSRRSRRTAVQRPQETTHSQSPLRRLPNRWSWTEPRSLCVVKSYTEFTIRLRPDTRLESPSLSLFQANDGLH